MNLTQFFPTSKELKAQVYTFLFYRDMDGKWYVDYPEYITHGYGTKANLQMVAGADIMLESIAPEGVVEATFSNSPMETYDIHLRRMLTDPWGATYTMANMMLKTVWLCNVSKFIFRGHHPRHIYIQFNK